VDKSRFSGLMLQSTPEGIQGLSKSSAVTRETSRCPKLWKHPSILLGVGQACGMRTRPLPFRRAVARRELDFDRALGGYDVAIDKTTDLCYIEDLRGALCERCFVS
jgi:hypothetical protein